MSATTYTATCVVQEDPETGDCYVVLPDGLCEQLGWEVGDTLAWDVRDDGSAVVTNVSQTQRGSSSA